MDNKNPANQIPFKFAEPEPDSKTLSHDEICAEVYRLMRAGHSCKEAIDIVLGD